MKISFFSAKGFIFTISIIFFASTLVFFSQEFLRTNLDRETILLDSFSSLNQPILVDDLSTDLLDLFDVSLDVNDFDLSIDFLISGTISPDYNLVNKVNDYDDFLKNSLLASYSGENSLDLSNLNDGSMEIFIGDDFNLIYQYDINNLNFNSNNDLKKIDLNLYNIIDINHIEENTVSGSVPLTINYFDDSNYISITKSISNSSESTIKFVYEDNNILLTIVNNGVFIDSDISSLLNYDLGLQYAFDKNILPIYINSKLVSIGKKYYSENLLKIK